MQKIVVCGQSRATVAITAHLLRQTQRFEVALAALDLEALEMASLAVLSTLGANQFAKATSKTLGEADILVITDYGSYGTNDWREQMLAQMRKVISNAMAAGFQGKILVAAHEDGLMTYFAQRFSGLAKTVVFGLGTMGLTSCFEKTVATALSVPRAAVTAYVVGGLMTPVYVWSRAYVAATPLLSLLQPESGQAHPLLSAVPQACAAFAAADAAMLWPSLVVRVLAALAGEVLLAPLTVITARGTYATPMLADADGVRPLADLTGAEAEEAALETLLVDQAAVITAIEKGEPA